MPKYSKHGMVWNNEAEMCAAVVAELRRQGWKVYQEVRSHYQADMVAVREGVVWVLEAKMSPNLDVLEQAHRWKEYAHRHSVVIPGHQSGFFDQICTKFGIGIITASPTLVRITLDRIAPVHNDRPLMIDHLLRVLDDRQQDFRPAGTNKGQVWTGFKKFMHSLAEVVAEYPNGVSVMALSKLKDERLTHYQSASTFRAQVPAMVAKGLAPRTKVVDRGLAGLYLEPCPEGHEQGIRMGKTSS